MKNLALFSFLVLVAAGCASTSGPEAVATLASTSGSTAAGTVTFDQKGDGSVDVVVALSGVTPGMHGFHIHEKGDCGDNGNAAGGHFNPMAMQHGAPGMPPHHAGDFGNVTAGPDGTVSLRFNTRSVTLTAGPASALGHAVILHANPDDLQTQPTGNAGARIACGVIQLK